MSNTGNNILFIDAVNPTTIGLGAGDDRYVLSGSNLAATQTITIDDSQGVNTLQLVGGLAIASSQVFNNAIQLKLSNGATVNVLNASTFKFLTGGDAFTGTGGLTQTFNQFVTVALGSTVPAAGAAPAVSVGSVTLPNPGGGTATPTFSITGAAAVAEGASATYTVTLSAAQSGATSVDYTLAGTGGAVLGTDTGVVANGTLNFAAGEVTKTIVVPFSSDSVTPEAGEGVSVTLSGPSLGTALSATAATVTTAITDVPVQFSVAPNAAAVDEGDSVTFTVTLSVAQATASTVTYTLTGAGGAVLGTDTGVNAPVGNTGTLTFAAGEMSKTIVVPIAKDTISPEAGEGVTLTLATPSVGTVGAAATATITDVPVTYTLTASAASVYEGAPITYTLTASAPASAATTVDFSVVPGASTAANDQGTGLTNLNDFTQSSFNPTSFVIAAGATTATYVVTSATDALTELPETYSVKAVIGGTEVATKSTTLLDGGSANAGQTFTLTTGVDLMPAALKGSNGNTNTAGNDLIVGIAGTGATLNASDDVNGGDGIDTLRVISDLVTAIPLTAVSNVEIIEVRSASAGAGSIDTSAKAGITNLNITSATDVTSFTATAAATTDVSVSGAATALILNGGKDVTVTDATASKAITVSTGAAAGNAVGAISVTDSKQGAADIKVDGGTSVAVTATSDKVAAVGVITVGAFKAATGAVTVTQNVTNDATVAAVVAGDVTVTGGSTITINANLTNTAIATGTNGRNITAGTYTATASDTTTAVTINQTAIATSIAAATTGATKETAVLTFGALAIGEAVLVGVTGGATGGTDLTFTASKALTAAEVAAAIASLTDADTQAAGGKVANGVYTGTLDAGWTSAAASGSTVTFTAAATGNSTDLLVYTDADGAGIADNKAADNAKFTAVTTTGLAGTPTAAVTVAASFGAVVVDDNAVKSVTTVSLNGFSKADLGANSALDNLATLNLTNGAGTTALTSTATTLAMNVNGMKAASAVTLGATVATLNLTTTGAASDIGFTAAGAKTINITAGANLDTVGGVFAAAETVTITGAGSVVLGNISATAKSISAAAATGAITATVDGTKAVVTTGSGADAITVNTAGISKAISLGDGDDTLTLSAATATVPTAAVTGGNGTDTVAMTFASADALDASAGFKSIVTGFERLTISDSAGAATLDLDNLGFTNYVQTSGSAGALVLDKMANNGTVVLTASQTGTMEVKITDATTGTADVLNVLTTANTTPINFGTLTANKVETINITVNDVDNGTPDSHSLTLAADSVTSITIGNANDLYGTPAATDRTNFSLTVTGATALATVNASGMKGVFTYTAGQGVTTVTGGSGNDVLAAAGSGDTLIGGAGNDTLTGADLTTLTGGAGNDTFMMNKPSNVNSYSTITDLASGDVIDFGAVATIAFTKSAVVLAGTAVFQDYANAAVNALTVALDAQGNDVAWFQFSGNTYIVQSGNTTDGNDFVNGSDSIIQIVGLVDLSTASYNQTNATLEIA